MSSAVLAESEITAHNVSRPNTLRSGLWTRRGFAFKLSGAARGTDQAAISFPWKSPCPIDWSHCHISVATTTLSPSNLPSFRPHTFGELHTIEHKNIVYVLHLTWLEPRESRRAVRINYSKYGGQGFILRLSFQCFVHCRFKYCG